MKQKHMMAAVAAVTIAASVLAAPQLKTQPEGLVAGELKASFRSDDIISRIGGDEFSVIMKNADSRIKDIVLNKVRTAAERLRDPGDGLPSITLSVGIAFGDRENPAGDIFKDADTALYRVKRQGRDGCAIY